MGLNESYNQVRSQILLMSLLPTVNQAHSMIIQEEIQRSITIPGKSVPVDGTAMVTRGLNNGHGRGRGNQSLECSHCHKKGHVKENCYHIVGFPANFRSNKGKKPQDAKANQAFVELEDSEGEMVKDSALMAATFTQQQYEQILELLKKDLGEVTVHALTTTSGMNKPTPFKASKVNWIIDSGASNHIVGDLRYLENCERYNRPIRTVKIPNGDRVVVTHIGTVTIAGCIKLENVLYSPQLCFNLISVSKLTNKHNCIAAFFPGFCTIQDLVSGKIRVIGRLGQGLYIVHVERRHQVLATAYGNRENSNLWHNRLGHTPLNVIRQLNSLNLKDVRDLSNKKCEVCMQSKQT